MTKEEFVEMIDIQEGDKVYFVTYRPIKEYPLKFKCHRINHGFNATELIGLLEETKIDLFLQGKGAIEPKIIEHKREHVI